MRLLLVEDDAMIGEAIRTGLKRDGFTVDWVHDGESADQVLRTDSFDANACAGAGFASAMKLITQS